MTLPGYELRFFTNDHAPPHFHLCDHAESFELRVYFLEVTPDHFAADVVYIPTAKPARLLDGRDRRRLTRLILEDQGDLLAEWSALHS